MGLRNAISVSIFSVTLGVTGIASASSHREAPAIAEDQYADNTDVYAFISPRSSDRIVFVANYVPLLAPASGPNFYRFADTVLYEIRVDNDGDAVADISFEYRFRTTVRDGTTFLYNAAPITGYGPMQGINVIQTYSVTRRDLDTGTGTEIATDVNVAPWFVGRNTFPGATATASDANYEGVARAAIRDAMGRSFFAGPRDEPFFVDLNVFDLLGVGARSSGGGPTIYGANVMSIVLEVPITDVASGGVRPATATTATSQVGIYATASRRQVRILRRGRTADHHGQWIQVSRLAWPLVNEALVPLQDKDRYNRTLPQDDVTNFGAYVLFPSLPGLLNAVLGLTCPATPMAGRLDLVGLLSPNMTTPADLLRINIATGQTFANSHFPNGRALADDVVDTELTVLCALPMGMGLTPIGDGLSTNDRPFTDTGMTPTFPYLPTPHTGNRAPAM